MYKLRMYSIESNISNNYESDNANDYSNVVQPIIKDNNIAALKNGIASKNFAVIKELISQTVG